MRSLCLHQVLSQQCLTLLVWNVLGAQAVSLGTFWAVLFPSDLPVFQHFYLDTPDEPATGVLMLENTSCDQFVF